MDINSFLIQTPFGSLCAVADKNFLYFLKFIEEKNFAEQILNLEKKYRCTIKNKKNNILEQLEKELTHYFYGTLQNFTIPTKLHGTPFQQQCWQALRTIPYGSTTSYLQQARSIQAPQSFRAVANANRSNPIAILYPCHRIIKSNGDLCGYNGGVDKKQALLELEKKYRYAN